MYKPIYDLQLSPDGQALLARIQRDLELMRTALALIQLGQVYNLLLGLSGHASRLISIATSDWETSQQAGNHTGLAGNFINAARMVLHRNACLTAMNFPSGGQEREFWISVAGDQCSL